MELVSSGAVPRSSITIRRALLFLTAFTALTAVLAGLARLGVSVAYGPSYAFAHGPLFVLAVFATVIGLERAVALARGWGFIAPVLGASAGVAMLVGLAWAPWLAAASVLALVLVNVAIVQRQAAAFTWLMLLGALVLLVGSVGWALGRPIDEVVASWIAFFVLTITAERLELSRLAPTPRWASGLLVVLACALAVAACARLGSRVAPMRALGVCMALLGAWQLRYDLARRTVRQRGLPRFAAVGVLAGAAWLLLIGVFIAAVDIPAAGFAYDAALHGVFVGYVLSMVFAHAPIILPAVARMELTFHPVLYVPLAVLHAGLAVRVAGDLLADQALRQAGGVTNAVAIALFPVAVIAARALTRRRSVLR